jgi:4-aminobutyrate aminotransferase-like enzyme
MNMGVNTETVKDSIDKLFSLILSEQQKINKVSPPDSDKIDLLNNLLDKFSNVRGKGFFYQYLSSGKGHGPFTQLVDGSVKFDLINGIGVNLLGHSHPLYIRSHLEASTSDTVMCGNLLPYKQAYEVTEKIIQSVSGSKLSNFWFAGSGSFANDTALKLIWQKKAPKYKLIAFEKAFAGRSIATQNITYNSSYREGMPKSIEVEHVPHFDQSNPDLATKKTIDALDEIWAKDPDNYCAIMLEVVQGEGGFIYGTQDYYTAICEWAKSKGIYVWVDEVQSFGRTRELFAFQMFQLEKYVDIVTVGKALQACGVLYSKELNPKPGLIAGTFNGSIASLEMASKTLDFLQNGNFYGPQGRIIKLEEKFINKLKNLKSSSCKDKIGYIGGIGTMISFEVGDSSSDLTKKFLKKLFENGIIAFSAGKNPVRVRFLLPITITDEQIDEIFKILEKTILEMI